MDSSFSAQVVPVPKSSVALGSIAEAPVEQSVHPFWMGGQPHAAADKWKTSHAPGSDALAEAAKAAQL
jgi:hypothetical protein